MHRRCASTSTANRKPRGPLGRERRLGRRQLLRERRQLGAQSRGLRGGGCGGGGGGRALGVEAGARALLQRRQRCAQALELGQKLLHLPRGARHCRPCVGARHSDAPAD